MAPGAIAVGSLETLYRNQEGRGERVAAAMIAQACTGTDAVEWGSYSEESYYATQGKPGGQQQASAAAGKMEGAHLTMQSVLPSSHLACVGSSCDGG